MILKNGLKILKLNSLFLHFELLERRGRYNTLYLRDSQWTKLYLRFVTYK